MEVGLGYSDGRIVRMVETALKHTKLEPGGSLPVLLIEVIEYLFTFLQPVLNMITGTDCDGFHNDFLLGTPSFWHEEKPYLSAPRR